jgi:uncharacterized integral membrane protein (TIGR00697 family)
MEGGILYIGRILIELFFITLLSRFGKEWLYGTIVVNLLLITTLGSKIVSVFGFTMNAGNVFYASIFYAIILILEFHGKAAALRAVWQSSALLIFSLILAELTVSAGGAPASRVFDEAIRGVFQMVPRIGIASLIAFIISQSVAIGFYERLKKKTKNLWIRNGSAAVVVQMIDSLIFFPLAFYGAMSAEAVVGIAAAGFFAKLLVGLVSTPFIYFAYYLKKE